MYQRPRCQTCSRPLMCGDDWHEISKGKFNCEGCHAKLREPEVQEGDSDGRVGVTLPD